MDKKENPLSLRVALRFVEIWLSTCRMTLDADEQSKGFFSRKEQVIVALWHSGLIYILYHFRKFPAAIMVSPSKDGEWVARALRIWGQHPVRGSRLKGGLHAIREMTRMLRERGFSAGIVADGSKGPNQVAQLGALILSRDTGYPIVPVGFGAKWAYYFNSWDKMVLPMPFSKVSMVYRPPIYVEKKCKGKELEEKRLLLQQELNKATERARRISGASSRLK